MLPAHLKADLDAHANGNRVKLPDLINDDGELYRFTTPGDKPGQKAGWYISLNILYRLVLV